jgi:predicted GH43/DUF377 family glycosyl hydrolase
MSPAVGPNHQMLYRRVLERSGDASRQSEYEDRSVIALATSTDGLRFQAQKEPVLLAGGPRALIGVEDPTIVQHEGEYIVFYTGWSGWATGIASLLWARGPSVRSLQPQGVAIEPSGATRFVKEAEYRTGLLWVEVDTIDEHEHSRIARCYSTGRSPLGPWSPPAVIAEARPGHWDSVNVSTGPLIEDSGRLYMLYNGMIKTEDPDFVHAARIGLMELDPQSGAVLGRSVAPVLEPPPHGRIAFAASLANDVVYYTVDDREIWAAHLDRRQLASTPMEPRAGAPRPPAA